MPICDNTELVFTLERRIQCLINDRRFSGLHRVFITGLVDEEYLVAKLSDIIEGYPSVKPDSGLAVETYKDDSVGVVNVCLIGVLTERSTHGMKELSKLLPYIMKGSMTQPLT